jgi:hypothetical protein
MRANISECGQVWRGTLQGARNQAKKSYIYQVLLIRQSLHVLIYTAQRYIFRPIRVELASKDNTIQSGSYWQTRESCRATCIPSKNYVPAQELMMKRGQKINSAEHAINSCFSSLHPPRKSGSLG